MQAASQTRQTNNIDGRPPAYERLGIHVCTIPGRSPSGGSAGAFGVPLLSNFGGRFEPHLMSHRFGRISRSNANAQITSRFCVCRPVMCEAVTQTAETEKTCKAKIDRMTEFPLIAYVISHHYSSSESSSSSSSSSAGTIRRLRRDEAFGFLAVCLVGFVLMVDLSPGPSP